MKFKWSLLPILSLLSVLLNAASAQNVGFKQLTIATKQTRPLHVAIWYPTHQIGPVATLGENVAFVGTQVIKGATVDASSAPVVLLSHGYRGNGGI